MSLTTKNLKTSSSAFAFAGLGKASLPSLPVGTAGATENKAGLSLFTIVKLTCWEASSAGPARLLEGNGANRNASNPGALDGGNDEDTQRRVGAGAER